MPVNHRIFGNLHKEGPDGGLPGWVIPVGAIVVIAAAGGAIVASRRRTGEDRE